MNLPKGIFYALPVGVLLCFATLSPSYAGKKQPNLDSQLVLAVAKNNKIQVASLIKKVTNINTKTKIGDKTLTPLLIAVMNEHLDITRLLLENGASVYATYGGYTAWEYVMISKNRKLIELMQRYR